MLLLDWVAAALAAAPPLALSGLTLCEVRAKPREPSSESQSQLGTKTSKPSPPKMDVVLVFSLSRPVGSLWVNEAEEKRATNWQSISRVGWLALYLMPAPKPKPEDAAAGLEPPRPPPPAPAP